jgi:hypothetical protein
MDSSFWNDTESVSTRHSETPDLWSGVLLVAARARFSVTQLLVVSILTIARVARCTDNVKGVVDEQLVGVFWVRIRSVNGFISRHGSSILCGTRVPVRVFVVLSVVSATFGTVLEVELSDVSRVRRNVLTHNSSFL